jgi:hypothetical protein
MTDIIVLASPFVFLGIMFAIAVWGTICNTRTYAYRKRVLIKTFELKSQRLRAGLDPNGISYPAAGTYEKTVLRMMLFRRYDDLYEVKP